jgi:osmotically-inducible protein OsmY
MEIRPDDEVTANVIAQLRRDGRVDAAEIAVRADRGIVTLVGSVDTPLQRTAAEHAAERVTGALMIENRLSPRPPGRDSRADAVLRAAALQTLAYRGVAVGEEVDVEAHAGQVTLTGRLGTSAEREAAGAAVAALPQVHGVTNEIRVPTDP